MHDGEEMVRCPYNRSHVVLKHRLASHLVKCRRQNPQKEFMRCPFNSSHDIPASEFENHTKTCKDRKKLESFSYIVGAEQENEKKVLFHPEVNSTEENWDEEPDVPSSYLDEKDKINSSRMVSRLPPTGMSKSERKAFYHAEAQRLEEIIKKEIASNSSVTSQSFWTFMDIPLQNKFVSESGCPVVCSSSTMSLTNKDVDINQRVETARRRLYKSRPWKRRNICKN